MLRQPKFETSAIEVMAVPHTHEALPANILMESGHGRREIETKLGMPF